MDKTELENILHLSGCQQRTAGYNEAKQGKDLNTDDMEQMEQTTLDEVWSWHSQAVAKQKAAEYQSLFEMSLNITATGKYDTGEVKNSYAIDNEKLGQVVRKRYLELVAEDEQLTSQRPTEKPSKEENL